MRQFIDFWRIIPFACLQTSERRVRCNTVTSRLLGIRRTDQRKGSCGSCGWALWALNHPEVNKEREIKDKELKGSYVFMWQHYKKTVRRSYRFQTRSCWVIRNKKNKVECLNYDPNCLWSDIRVHWPTSSLKHAPTFHITSKQTSLDCLRSSG